MLHLFFKSDFESSIGGLHYVNSDFAERYPYGADDAWLFKGDASSLVSLRKSAEISTDNPSAITYNPDSLTLSTGKGANYLETPYEGVPEFSATMTAKYVVANDFLVLMGNLGSSGVLSPAWGLFTRSTDNSVYLTLRGNDGKTIYNTIKINDTPLVDGEVFTVGISYSVSSGLATVVVSTKEWSESKDFALDPSVLNTTGRIVHIGDRYLRASTGDLEVHEFVYYKMGVTASELTAAVNKSLDSF